MEQVVVIPASATAFTAVCDACVELDAIADWSGSTFAGRLDLDIRRATFLCRRGHPIRVERADAASARDTGSAAA